jgi:tRNA threonylcarbamoyl adenosine modification protein YjeE
MTIDGFTIFDSQSFTSLQELSLIAERIKAILLKDSRQCLSVGLVGQLGAGKTAFTRALVGEFEEGVNVSSPTFILQNIYFLKRYNISFEHWDLYRLSELPEELQAEPQNCASDSKVIRFIEWPDIFPLYHQSLDYIISLTPDETYSIRTFEFYGKR